MEHSERERFWERLDQSGKAVKPLNFPIVASDCLLIFGLTDIPNLYGKICVSNLVLFYSFST